MADVQREIPILRELLTAYNDATSGRRILALMGPNGAGKSRLLKSIKKEIEDRNLPLFFLPAGQRSQIEFQPPITPNGLRGIQDMVANFAEAMVTKPSEGRDSRSRNVLFKMLERAQAQDAQNEHQYRELLVQAVDNNATLPTRKPPLFPDIKQAVANIFGYDAEIIRHTGVPARLEFHRGDLTFTEDGLSDGERQLLIIAIFLVGNFDKRFLFIVDEPELHLNEARAIEVWEKIERSASNATFLYSTHSVAFATREAVQTTYLINSEKVEEVNRTDQLRAADIHDIVSARIQLYRSAKPAIFCEDELSKLIFGDLFKDRTIVRLNGSESVRLAVQGARGWEQVRSEGIKFCGIIDRDTRNEAEIEQLKSMGLFCFPLYDAEALLLTPEIAVSSISKSTNKEFDHSSYQTLLITAAEESVGITLDRIRKYLTNRASPTLSFRKTEAGVTDVTATAPKDLEERFKKAAEALFRAIGESDETKILELVYGKFAYRRFAHLLSAQLKIDWPESATQRYLEFRHTKDFAEVFEGITWLKAFKLEVDSYLHHG
jgi:energy-coupling factor transporter ATP-binding protein EcfA2